MQEPIPSFNNSLKLSTALSTTIWKFFTVEPSFKSKKQKLLPPPSLNDLTQPPTFIILPIHFSAPGDVKASILTLPPNEVYLIGFFGAEGEFVSSMFNSFRILFNESTSF